MEKFSHFVTKINESMDIINIDNTWLNQANDDELSRIAICFNNGKGQKVYSYKDIIKSLSGNVDNMTASDIFEAFFNKLGTNKDGAYSIYFDNGHYKIIKWK